MNRIITSILITGALFLNFQACKAQTEAKLNVETVTEGDGKMLLGPQMLTQFDNAPYNDWFGKEYLEYALDSKSIAELRNHNWNNINMTVFVGTWCSDSHREFPRLIKILNEINFPVEKLTIIAADRKKQTPGGEHAIFKVEKVPTVILSKDGQELGRITESPLSGYLERDLLQILKGK